MAKYYRHEKISLFAQIYNKKVMKILQFLLSVANIF